MIFLAYLIQVLQVSVSAVIDSTILIHWLILVPIFISYRIPASRGRIVNCWVAESQLMRSGLAIENILGQTKLILLNLRQCKHANCRRREVSNRTRRGKLKASPASSSGIEQAKGLQVHSPIDASPPLTLRQKGRKDLSSSSYALSESTA